MVVTRACARLQAQVRGVPSDYRQHAVFFLGPTGTSVTLSRNSLRAHHPAKGGHAPWRSPSRGPDGHQRLPPSCHDARQAFLPCVGLAAWLMGNGWKGGRVGALVFSLGAGSKGNAL